MTIDKVALITGSGTGVGAASALALAARGWHVVIHYARSEAQARATPARCDAGAAQGAETRLLQGDMAQDADCRALVAATAKRCGRIDALVNNAGVTSFAGAANWDAIDAETFQHIVGVNALGSLQMIRAAAPQLKAAAGGVVNVSSIAGALDIGSSTARAA